MSSKPDRETLLEEYRALTAEVATLLQLRDTTLALAVSAVGVVLGLGKGEQIGGAAAILLVIAIAAFITWTASHKAWYTRAYLSVFVESVTPGLSWNTMLSRHAYHELGLTTWIGYGWIRQHLLLHCYPFAYLTLSALACFQGTRSAMQAGNVLAVAGFCVLELVVLYWVVLLQDSNSVHRYQQFIQQWERVKSSQKMEETT